MKKPKKIVKVQGFIEEELILGKAKWFVIKFPNGSTITIKQELCELLN